MSGVSWIGMPRQPSLFRVGSLLLQHLCRFALIALALLRLLSLCGGGGEPKFCSAVHLDGGSSGRRDSELSMALLAPLAAHVVILPMHL